MDITLRQIGNSHGLILPKEVMKHYDLKKGDRLELVIEPDRIVLKLNKADISSQLEAASIGMKKYKPALKELAK